MPVIRTDGEGNKETYSSLSEAAKQNLTCVSCISKAISSGLPFRGHFYEFGNRKTTEGNTFAARLKRLREESGISIGAMSADTGISAVSIWQYENYKGGLNAKNLSLIADYFGVTMDYLWKGVTA